MKKLKWRLHIMNFSIKTIDWVTWSFLIIASYIPCQTIPKSKHSSITTKIRAVISDHQILVHLGDRIYQHILWTSANTNLPVEYELTTVTYGLKISRFITQRVLLQLSIDLRIIWFAFVPELCPLFFVNISRFVGCCDKHYVIYDVFDVSERVYFAMFYLSASWMIPNIHLYLLLKQRWHPLSLWELRVWSFVEHVY